MFNNLLKKVKGLFVKEKKGQAKDIIKPPIINSDNSVREFKVISNNKKNHMKCQNCEKEIGKDNIKSAKSDDGSYYYSRCSCGFVNKIIDKKAYTPGLSEVRNAYELFRKNDIRFDSYSTTQNGEVEAL